MKKAAEQLKKLILSALIKSMAEDNKIKKEATAKNNADKK